MPVDDFLQIDRSTVEIGARLIPLVEPKRGTGLLDRIGGLQVEAHQATWDSGDHAFYFADTGAEGGMIWKLVIKK